MTFKEAIRTCLREKYFVFRGRAPCSEFWFFALFTFLIYLFIAVFLGTWANKSSIGQHYGTQYDMSVLRTVGTIIYALLFLPSVAVIVRRFHDHGLSYWWYFGAVLAALIIGVSEIFIFMGSLFVTVPQGERFVNKFGADPTRPEGPDNLYEYIAAGPSVEITQLMEVTGHVFEKRSIAKMGCMVLVGIAIIIAYFGLWYEKLKYAPAVYEDGSVEYRLIYKGRDLERGTRDDQHWVLRFPKELDVIIPELQTEFERVSPKPYAGNYNYKLRFYVNLPEFTLVKSRESYDDINLLSVALYASEIKYGTDSNKKQTSSFSSRHDQSTKRRCRKDTEIIPGLFSLRDPSASEIQAMYDEYGEDARHYVTGCGSFNPKVTDYSFNDPSGRSWGTGYCRNQKIRECTFRVWLPYNRTAIYRFNHKYLTQIHDIHQGVIDLLKAATDIEKSRNISFEKE